MSEQPFQRDEKIKFTLSIGLQGRHEDIQTVGEWLNVTEFDLSTMSTEQVHQALHETHEDWVSNFLDAGWCRQE